MEGSSSTLDEMSFRGEEKKTFNVSLSMSEISEKNSGYLTPNSNRVSKVIFEDN